MTRTSSRLIAAVLTGLLAVLPSQVFAQPSLKPAPRPAGQPAVPQTDVAFELLAASNSASLHAQEWGAELQRLGVSCRIQQAFGDEKLEVTEGRVGRIRVVKVVGLLDRDGSILAGGRRYSRRDNGRLREWIDELKTYGAQGSTQGKPGFGLSAPQFQKVFQCLEQAIEEDPAGQQLDAALTALKLPEELPLRLSTAASEHLGALRSEVKMPRGLKGLSRGTVLAIALNAVGLGFQPGRTPAGTLELVVVPLSDETAVWPVGWPLDKAPVHAMPKLLEIVPIEIDKQPVTRVIELIEQKTGAAIVVDARSVSEAGIDLKEMRVSYGPRRDMWSPALDHMLFPKLMREQLQDEAGRPFLWVTTRTVKKLNARAAQRDARDKAAEPSR